MRRSFLKHLATCAIVGAIPSITLLSRNASANAAATSFDTLMRPALLTAKARGAAMLAVVRAGRRLVAVGERGIILLSDDDAASWSQAEVPVSVTLTGVQFVDERRGWAIGHLGVVLHTEDGGAHWVRQLDGVQAAAIALQAGHAAGSSVDAEHQLAAAKVLVDDGPDKPFLDLHFENERTGYVVGAYNLAFRTDDGGNTWQSWMGRLANPKGLHLYAIKAAGKNLYIAGERGLLLRSVDGGQSFVPAPSPSKGTYFGLVTTRDNELLLYGLRGRAFWSRDDAANWIEVDTSTRSTLSAGVCLADGTILLASQAGELMVSHTAGRSFTSLPDGEGLPITDLVQSATGRLIASSMRGISTLKEMRSAS